TRRRRPQTAGRSWCGRRTPGRASRRFWCAAVASSAGRGSGGRSGRRRAHAGGWNAAQRIARRQRRGRRLLAGFGELHGPGALLAGIDFEKAGAIETARQAIADAAYGELLVARAHEGLPHPFAAAIVIDGVDIIITRDESPFDQGLTGASRPVPPAIRHPGLGVLVTDG